MGIGTAVDSMDLSSDFNKSKYKNEKMTTAGGNKWENKLEIIVGKS